MKEIVYAKDRRIIGYISVNIYREIKLNREDRVSAASHDEFYRKKGARF